MDHRNQFFAQIANLLEVPEYRTEFFLHSFIPHYNASENTIKIGRFVKGDCDVIKANSRQSNVFAYTNHALRHMEQLAISIHLHEHVLLIGETGTGKTTIVQHLSHVFGKKLIVLNMSQQSDSSDLLGIILSYLHPSIY